MGARCRAGAGSPRPHRPHPGHTGRGTLAARSRGRAAGGETAPDTRRPSQQWQATPPGDSPPPPPRHAAPTGHASQGDGVGPPHPHTHAHSMWVADPNSPPNGGQRLTSGAPHNGGRHPPRGRPSATCTASNAGPQGRTLWGWCWVPTPAPTAPGTPDRGTLAAHSRGRAVGGGAAPDTRRPSQRWQAPPRGLPFRHPHSEQRRPARAHVVGLVLGPHAGSDRTRDTRVAEPWPPAPKDERPGEGQRLTPGAPRNGGRPPPRGQPPNPPAPPRHAAPTGHAGRGDGVEPPHPHTRAHSTCVEDPNSPPNRRAVGGGTAPDLRRPSHNGGRHPPRGRPSATPTASNAGPQGRTLWGRCWVPTPAPTATGTPDRGTLAAHSRGRAVGGGAAPDTRRPSQRWQAPPPGDALPPPPQRATPARNGARCGAGAGSPRRHRLHPGHTGRGTLAARSKGRAAGGGTAPDTRRPSQRWQATPPGTAPHHPRGTQPPQGMQARGKVFGRHTHTPAPTARAWRTPTARAIGGQSGEGQRLTSDAPHTMVEGAPPGDALPPPPQRAKPARRGARCGAGAGSPRPRRLHPGHTGRGTLAARSRGRAAGGGTAPNTRRPSP